ncbi:MAG: DUF1127 domain-containing protein [Beijerinckiaceae bacterium]|nr:DUF1127 domain-containing protein [Beijerinckiaceae bacterium]
MIVLSSALSVSTAAFTSVRGLAVAALAGAGKLVRSLRNRHDIRQLAELDDHALKDIGLTRTDVHGALATSLLADPSLILRDIAGMDHGRAASQIARRPTVPVPAEDGVGRKPAAGRIAPA